MFVSAYLLPWSLDWRCMKSAKSRPSYLSTCPLRMRLGVVPVRVAVPPMLAE